jgi:hypothetical protein
MKRSRGEQGMGGNKIKDKSKKTKGELRIQRDYTYLFGRETKNA